MSEESLRLLNDLTHTPSKSRVVAYNCNRIITNLTEKLNPYSHVNFSQLRQYPRLLFIMSIPEHSYESTIGKVPKYYGSIMKEITIFDILIQICTLDGIFSILFPMLNATFVNAPKLWYTHHTLSAYYQSKIFPSRFFKNCMDYLYRDNMERLIMGLSSIFISHRNDKLHLNGKIMFQPLTKLLSNNEVIFNSLSPKVCKKIVRVCLEKDIVNMLNNFQNKEKLLKVVIINKRLIKIPVFQNYCNKLRLSMKCRGDYHSRSVIKTFIKYNVPVNTSGFYILLCSPVSRYVGNDGKLLLRELFIKGFNLYNFYEKHSIGHLCYAFSITQDELDEMREEYDKTVYPLVTYCLRNLNYEELLKYEGHPQLNELHYLLDSYIRE